MSLNRQDLEELAGLFLHKRLATLADELVQRQDEVVADARQRGMASGSMIRGLLVTAFGEALQEHGIQVSEDLLGLLRAFRCFAHADGVRHQLELHLQAAASVMVDELASSSVGGVSQSPAEQRRVANLVASCKREVAARLETEIREVERGIERRAQLAIGADDLDDRLPLARRGVFDHDLVVLTQAAVTRHEPVALVMLDIDHFKRVNDEYGHSVGDEVLLAVAQVMVTRCRAKGRAYRYGGEEFALLLPAYSSEEAVGLAERVRKDIATAPLSSRGLTVTASFGVASLPDQAGGPKQLLELADGALYEAKNTGRNRVCCAAEIGC